MVTKHIHVIVAFSQVQSQIRVSQDTTWVPKVFTGTKCKEKFASTFLGEWHQSVLITASILMLKAWSQLED